MSSQKEKIFYYTSIISGLFIPLCGVILQLLLLYAFARDPLKCFKNLGMALVINLAIADFPACCTKLLYYFFQMFDFTGAKFLYEVFGRIVGQVSFFTILSISIDRFLLVVFPIRHRCWIKKKVLTAWLSLIWLLSVLYSLQRFIFSEEQKDEKLLYEGFTAALFLLSTVAYASVYIVLKKQVKNRAELNELGSIHNSEEVRLLKEKKFLKTIILIASLTFLSFTSGWIIITFFAKNSLPRIVFTVIFRALLAINFAVNPLIYIRRFPNYRKTFQMLYCRK